MLKSEARILFLKKRANIKLKDRNAWDDLILIQFQKLSLPPLQTVFTYAAMEHRKEIATDTIIDFLKFRNPGIQICYPVCELNTFIMSAIATTEHTEFSVNKFGINEPLNGSVCDPLEIDLVFVPLLCFDEHGYRVGYGKGVYDRYLAGLRNNAIKIGLSYFKPISLIKDTNEFDVPLNYCITPQNIYEF